MTLLDFPLNEAANMTLYQGDVFLRYPRRVDFDAWSHLREQSRGHLQPYEPLWAEGELSRPVFRKRLRAFASEIRAGSAQPYYIFRQENSALVGVCTLSNIRRRAAMTGTIGYWVGACYTRQGYGFSAVCAVAYHAFETLGLERLEAACLPHNMPSRKLLEKAGFCQEGRAKGYLQIAGRRQDHLLFGMGRDEFDQAMAALVV